jgi:hypothetical protein
MLVVKLGCSPHVTQRGDTGIWKASFSMAADNPNVRRKAS